MQRDSEVPANAVMRDVTIRGRREMIVKVKKIFQTVVQTNSAEVIMKLQSSRDGFEKMMIPNDKVGLVIGKGGAMIKALMARTVTQIQVPHDVDRDNPTLRPVIITGDSENVLEAKKQIQAIVDGQTGSLPEGMPVVTMTVPDDKVGLVIGKGGNVIRDIQMRTKSRIQIPGKPIEGSDPPMR